ncbi:MAG: HNH endonuclease family protein [Chloroflexi bacterium]|nr:HNH endonuclease family protein [Chloroflexota bacterium]
MWNRRYSTGKSRRIVLILESINRFFDGDSKLDGTGTVEHIMPQTLSPDWQTHLGDTWRDTQRELLHTIGNLTIVTQKWNQSKLSNKPFSHKRAALRKHGIHLNSTYFDDNVTTWNADAIRARTNYLADRIIDVWPAFAEQPRSEGVKGKTPLMLTVRDKRLAVYSWRGIVLEMVNSLHDLQLLSDLERALAEFEWWITQDPGGSQRYYKQS